MAEEKTDDQTFTDVSLTEEEMELHASEFDGKPPPGVGDVVVDMKTGEIRDKTPEEKAADKSKVPEGDKPKEVKASDTGISKEKEEEPKKEEDEGEPPEGAEGEFDNALKSLLKDEGLGAYTSFEELVKGSKQGLESINKLNELNSNLMKIAEGFNYVDLPSFLEFLKETAQNTNFPEDKPGDDGAGKDEGDGFPELNKLYDGLGERIKQYDDHMGLVQSDDYTPQLPDFLKEREKEMGAFKAFKKDILGDFSKLVDNSSQRMAVLIKYFARSLKTIEMNDRFRELPEDERQLWGPKKADMIKAVLADAESDSEDRGALFKSKDPIRVLIDRAITKDPEIIKKFKESISKNVKEDEKKRQQLIKKGLAGHLKSKTGKSDLVGDKGIKAADPGSTKKQFKKAEKEIVAELDKTLGDMFG